MFLFAGAEAAESRRGGSTMRRSTLYPAARSGGRWAYSEEPLAEIDFSPTADLWQKETGFVPVGKTTPNSRLQEIRAATQEVLARIAPLTLVRRRSSVDGSRTTTPSRSSPSRMPVAVGDVHPAAAAIPPAEPGCR